MRTACSSATADLKLVSIADLIKHRRRQKPLVRRVVDTRLPTTAGPFSLVGYESLVDEREHMALVAGDVTEGDEVLVRVHSQCVTGDVFHS